MVSSGQPSSLIWMDQLVGCIELCYIHGGYGSGGKLLLPGQILLLRGQILFLVVCQAKPVWAALQKLLFFQGSSLSKIRDLDKR